MTNPLNQLLGAAVVKQFLRRQHLLTYAEFGQKHSQEVVFYNHGWPGSRVGGHMLHEVGERLGVRIIAVDRPGFGASPFTPRHSLKHWAQSMQHLADHLDLERFSILGASGGAPFAAACARFVDAQRVSGLGLLCPLGPVTHTRGMCVPNKLLLRAARYWPGLCRSIWRLSAKVMALDARCMERWALNSVDRQAMLSAPHIAQMIRAAVLEGLRAGAQGVVHEMALAQRAWGFELQEINVPHVFMWHGMEDQVVPVTNARLYEAIPGCRPTYFDGDTHTTIIIKRFSQALEALSQGSKDTGMSSEPVSTAMPVAGGLSVRGLQLAAADDMDASTGTCANASLLRGSECAKPVLLQL